MSNKTTKFHVQVSLVGAGPGDAELITAAGLDRLRRAEVVVYDALANPALLAEAPAAAERIDAGKRARKHKLTQDEIHELLRDRAAAGRYVVRLKGGDPYLFGRGAEELIYLAKQGISCEVVPGVTSGIAAPMAAGIPVTHREHASSVTFVTGHEDPTKPGTAVDYAALAKLIAAGGTVCFYMGVGRLPLIAEALTAGGLDGATPAAAVQWGMTPRQRSVRATVTTLAEAVKREGVGSPAIIVVGAVAGLDEPGLDYFTARPMFGKTVLVTRTRQQASKLGEQLAALGANVLESPTIELVPPADWSEVDAAVRDVRQYDWLVLTSVNGVAALADRLDAMGLDARQLAGVRVAAIGDTTAAALRERVGVKADLVPTRYVAESLAGELIAEHEMAGKRCLLLRADIARPTLPKLLGEAGAVVTEVVAYQTQLAAALPTAVVEALREGAVDWVTFTSASTVRNLVEMLGDERTLLSDVRLASIGPITSEAMREAGLAVDVEAAVSNVEGLVEVIERGSDGGSTA
ncbi:uroporphyrinogen-III C-methyltransferase [Phycisphaerales bacterium AB-hyl4]|uniref:uroporphyrinogen-III C-methyltransferase n=1 Tax=Natronomicrosphaera hydrolytica TaxID=3242702 RepID=A0ABV4U0S4_9BACT